MKGLKHMNKLVNQRKNTNVMTVTAQHRHDLFITQCINNEVKTFNRKLYKIMQNKDNVRILHHESIREYFTQHGLHLNATGKSKVVNLMSKKISQIFEDKKKHPIILKWRTTLNNPSLVNSIPTVINEDHVDIGNKGRNEDQIESNNQGIRTSSKPKKHSNTKSDDFFMGMRTDKTVYESPTLIAQK